MKFLKKLFGIKNDSNDEKALTFPFETKMVNGKDAVSELSELRKNKSTIPVIMGRADDLTLLADNFENYQVSEESILSLSNDITFPAWFEKRASEDEDYYEMPHGEWDEKAHKLDLSVHLSVMTRKPLKKVVIGIIPVEHSWAVPAYLKLGGWNECPNPEVHLALMKKWEQEYGAKVACVSSDVIEFTVEQPPRTKEDAMKLAEEQFIYCADIVHQGVETIENLAATLMVSKVWYFWWD